jgi:hypothetical protein
MIALLLLPVLAAPVRAAPDDADPHEFVRVDARGALRSIDAVARTIRDLPEADRAEAAASLRALSVMDPYTRAALQLPFALDALVSRIPADAFDPLVRQDWVYLQEGLATHVDVLEALGVDLPVPTVGDPLSGRGVPLVDLDALLASDDPLALTAALLDDIIAIAQRIDAPTQERIEATSDRIEAVTGVVRPCPRGPHAVLPGQPWTLGMQLGGWHDALRRVEPFAMDPATGAQLQAMVEALDVYDSASSVTIYQLSHRVDGDHR